MAALHSVTWRVGRWQGMGACTPHEITCVSHHLVYPISNVWDSILMLQHKKLSQVDRQVFEYLLYIRHCTSDALGLHLI